MYLIGVEEIRLFVKNRAASAKFYADVFDIPISYQGLIPKFKLGSQQFLLCEEKNKANYSCTPAKFTVITTTKLLEVEDELKKKGIRYFIADREGLDRASMLIPTAIWITDVDGYVIELRNSLYPKDFGRIRA